MGSDLHMNPPSASQWRLVRGDGYVALYKRQTDGVYPVEHIENWSRFYMADDPQESVSNGMDVVLAVFAYGRYKTVDRDDLCNPSAAEPFAESYPRHELEDDNPLHRRRAELRRQLADVERQIKEKETE